MPKLQDVLLPLIVGSGIILVGSRWMYKNPKSVYPNWMFSNPDHPALLGGVRAWATFGIFAGCSMLGAGIGAVLLPPDSWATLIVMLLVGIIGAWYLRPRIPESAAGGGVGEGLDTAQTPKRQGFLSKKGKWVVGVSVVLGVLFLFGAFAAIGNSEVCQLAIQPTQSNPAAIEQLGTPIRKGLVISGTISISGPSGHADIAIPVSGPKAKGTLYAVGDRSAGIWKFDTLQLEIKGNAGRVDLLDGGQSKSAQP